MRGWFLVQCVLWLAGIGLAQISPAAVSPAQAEEPKKLSLNAVGDQEIQVTNGISLARDCLPRSGPRVGIIEAPRHGKLTERPVDMFTSYKADNPRAPCNERRTRGIGAYYKAKPGFRGIDRFRFVLVYYDGTAETYQVEIKVW